MTDEAHPHRVQLRRSRGWKMPPNTVSVARPGKWGNPYHVEEYGRQQAIAQYRAYVEEKLRRGELDIAELSGRNLACWCGPDEACHADVLLELANR
jgi:hypothetical protein